MKEDAGFQESCRKDRWEFPAGSTWIVFTDSASHALPERTVHAGTDLHRPPIEPGLPGEGPDRDPGEARRPSAGAERVRSAMPPIFTRGRCASAAIRSGRADLHAHEFPIVSTTRKRALPLIMRS